jgi:hypothetical protein
MASLADNAPTVEHDRIVGRVGDIARDMARGGGVALLATGAATIAWWALRLRGDPSQPRDLRIAGRAALLASVVLGTAALVPEMAGALGIR